jgi:hypothetical protein
MPSRAARSAVPTSLVVVIAPCHAPPRPHHGSAGNLPRRRIPARRRGMQTAGTSLRSATTVNFEPLIEGILKCTQESSGLPTLRTYWYDASTDALFTDLPGRVWSFRNPLRVLGARPQLARQPHHQTSHRRLGELGSYLDRLTACCARRVEGLRGCLSADGYCAVYPPSTGRETPVR